jgi:hypothetical protein
MGRHAARFRWIGIALATSHIELVGRVWLAESHDTAMLLLSHVLELCLPPVARRPPQYCLSIRSLDLVGDQVWRPKLCLNGEDSEELDVAA